MEYKETYLRYVYISYALGLIANAKQRQCLVEYRLKLYVNRRSSHGYSRQSFSSDWSSQSASPSQCQASLMHIPLLHWYSPSLHLGRDSVVEQTFNYNVIAYNHDTRLS